MARDAKRRTVLSALEWGTAELTKAGGPSPRLDAEVVLAHLMETERLRLYLDFDQPSGEAEAREYVARVKRRAAGEPVAYITGRKEFYSRLFSVDPGVLIPRPETECVVEAALKAIEGVEAPEVLDLCSGSGNIGVTIAAELPGARVTCVDLAPGPIATGGQNAARLGVADRVSFAQGDLLAPVAGRAFDLIVANPPYLPAGMIDTLQVEIRRYEPRGALDGGEDGADLVRRIAAGAPAHLKQGAPLVVEIGEFQEALVRPLFEGDDAYAGCSFGADLSGRTRFVAARKR